MQRDNGTESGCVQCYFKNIEAALVDLIRKEPAGILVGCVAWITSPPIIAAISRKAGAGLILDKFCSTDLVPFREIKGLPSHLCAAIYPDADPGLFDVSGLGMEAIRLVGFTRSRRSVTPLMHNKFLVFCSLVKDKPVPYAVWTGSTNFTINARSSFENAVFIRDTHLRGVFSRMGASCHVLGAV